MITDDNSIDNGFELLNFKKFKIVSYNDYQFIDSVIKNRAGFFRIDNLFD